MKDRPFEVGFREQASNHPKRHRSKAVVVSVGEKAGDTGQVWITETSVSEPLMTCRKVDPGFHTERENLSLRCKGSRSSRRTLQDPEYQGGAQGRSRS